MMEIRLGVTAYTVSLAIAAGSTIAFSASPAAADGGADPLAVSPFGVGSGLAVFGFEDGCWAAFEGDGGQAGVAAGRVYFAWIPVGRLADRDRNALPVASGDPATISRT
jgi:hypothetical protein